MSSLQMANSTACTLLQLTSQILQRHGQTTQAWATCRKFRVVQKLLYFTAMAPLPMLSTTTIITARYLNLTSYGIIILELEL